MLRKETLCKGKNIKAYLEDVKQVWEVSHPSNDKVTIEKEDTTHRHSQTSDMDVIGQLVKHFFKKS